MPPQAKRAIALPLTRIPTGRAKNVGALPSQAPARHLGYLTGPTRARRTHTPALAATAREKSGPYAANKEEEKKLRWADQGESLDR